MSDAFRDELLKLAFEFCPAGMLAVDAAGTIVLVNRQVERVFGYTRDELVGQSIERLVPPRFRTAHARHREGLTAAPEARPMGAGRELFGVRKDGTEVPVEIGLTPAATPSGTVVLASVVDIAARRGLKERATWSSPTAPCRG
jgi:PAS domain S-box-containing protein